MKFSILCSLALFLFSIRAYAADDQNGAWFGTFTNKELSKTSSFWAETQLRFGLEENETQQILFRAGFLKRLSDRQGLGLLYGYIETGEVSEHRLALQHTYKYGSVIGLNASHRIRLESRRFENSGFGSERFRYLIRFQKQTESNLKFVLWDEAFVHLRDNSITGNESFDRNRLFIGFRLKAKAETNLEFGYLNQYVPRNGQDLSEHLLVLYVFL